MLKKEKLPVLLEDYAKLFPVIDVHMFVRQLELFSCCSQKKQKQQGWAGGQGHTEVEKLIVDSGNTQGVSTELPCWQETVEMLHPMASALVLCLLLASSWNVAQSWATGQFFLFPTLLLYTSFFPSPFKSHFLYSLSIHLQW